MSKRRTMNEIGKTVGHLFVICKDEHKSEQYGRDYFFCKCDSCGKVVSIRYDKLKNDVTVACRDCSLKLNRKSMIAIGRVYGDFVVCEKIGQKYPDAHMKYYRCKCVRCGKLKEVSEEGIKNSRMKCKCNDTTACGGKANE